MILNSNVNKELFGVGVLCYQREHETLQTLLNLKKQNLKNVIILQDGSKENYEIMPILSGRYHICDKYVSDNDLLVT